MMKMLARAADRRTLAATLALTALAASAQIGRAHV